VAFAFGLLHGLGFAGALRDVGLPDHAIPLALLCFNVGVELGQLAFVGLVFALFSALPRVVAIAHELWGRDPWAMSAAVSRPASYAIGPLAAFWLYERTASFFGP
jgi:hypothetical protein